MSKHLFGIALMGLGLAVMLGALQCMRNVAGTWSVWLSGNYRLTFEIEGEDATNADLEDYH